MTTGPETVTVQTRPAGPDGSAEAERYAIALPAPVVSVLAAASEVVRLWRAPDPFTAGVAGALTQLGAALDVLDGNPPADVPDAEIIDDDGAAPALPRRVAETFCSTCGHLDEPGRHLSPDCPRYVPSPVLGGPCPVA